MLGMQGGQPAMQRGDHSLSCSESRGWDARFYGKEGLSGAKNSAVMWVTCSQNALTMAAAHRGKKFLWKLRMLRNDQMISSIGKRWADDLLYT